MKHNVTALTNITLYRDGVPHYFLEKDTFDVSDSEYVRLKNINIIKLTKEVKRNGD